MNQMDLIRYNQFLNEKHLGTDVNSFGGFNNFIKNHLLADKPMDENFEEELDVFIDTKFHGNSDEGFEYVELLFQVNDKLLGTIHVYCNNGEINEIELA
ncbi:hypothetical protein QBX67_00290 [Bacillus sp. LS15-K4]|nr:hypothetical protein [Bacillus sp. LS15-K4]MDJ1473920.1 hypothetical protein [Bacillus sp. LS15-K4]